MASSWRRALISLAVLTAGTLGAPGPTLVTAAGAAAPRLEPLLPLARGAVEVLLGDPPAWQPVAGRPLTLTLFSGRPALGGRVNAYIALQSPARGCASSPAADTPHPLTIPAFYSAAHLLGSQSVFAPGGGAAPGDYFASIPGVVIHGRGSVRACVWLTGSPRRRARPTVQDIPLLNGLFAASVSALPAPGAAAQDAYTLDAASVSQAFSFAVTTTQCGASYHDAGAVAPGDLGSAAISFLARPCASDASVFTFTSGGRSLGTLTYTPSQATAQPPAVARLGGCELEPLTVTSLAAAAAYLPADGCTLGRVLLAPLQRSLPRGAVIEAQVDGGVAAFAPAGTSVDVVLNGHP